MYDQYNKKASQNLRGFFNIIINFLHISAVLSANFKQSRSYLP